MLVFLDFGHGGSDPGATANGLVEKDLNLTAGRACLERLAELKIPVEASRTDDRRVTLAERVHRANMSKATCFVSLHHNASENPNARGFEVWHSILGGEGKRLAGLIVEALPPVLGIPSRGLKAKESVQTPGRDYHYVIRHTLMPAVIVEGGFVTNAQDAAVLRNPNILRAEGRAIADAVAAWLGIKATPKPGPSPETELARLRDKLARIKAILDE